MHIFYGSWRVNIVMKCGCVYSSFYTRGTKQTVHVKQIISWIHITFLPPPRYISTLLCGDSHKMHFYFVIAMQAALASSVWPSKLQKKIWILLLNFQFKSENAKQPWASLRVHTLLIHPVFNITNLKATVHLRIKENSVFIYSTSCQWTSIG